MSKNKQVLSLLSGTIDTHILHMKHVELQAIATFIHRDVLFSFGTMNCRWTPYTYMPIGHKEKHDQHKEEHDFTVKSLESRTVGLFPVSQTRKLRSKWILSR